MNLSVQPQTTPLLGEALGPGDKSISHRSLLFGAMAEGETTVSGFLAGEDCHATLNAVTALGVTVIQGETPETLTIRSPGYAAFAEPADLLDCGTPGRTRRLLLGLLAARPFVATLTGDATLRRRPMARVGKPLQQMGAQILGRAGGTLAPLTIQGGDLQPIHYVLPVASAQIKSALMLAALQTPGESTITEPLPSRNHTEIMLPAFGGHYTQDGLTIRISGPQHLHGTHVEVPADISSAAFPLIAALSVPGSDVTLLRVGVNPTRIGLLTTLREMGADLTWETPDTVGEPMADIRIRYRPLKGVAVPPERIPLMIDELPILAVLATQAEGETVITGAEELRVKESDRISRLVELLRLFGADITERPDGWTVTGKTPLHGASVTCWGDHRLAMSAAVAGLIATGQTVIQDADAIQTSFPGFAECLEGLGATVHWS
ncbi:MAG: 3-phosphoshikimate 1-carboxyvinyltransferase [Candidatus Sericytochromatia bacterium]|nr:3-phosphoshikimate 1-carboxyvinyltransferase [Candidatus Sericytochromatia bacterium]